MTKDEMQRRSPLALAAACAAFALTVLRTAAAQDPPPPMLPSDAPPPPETPPPDAPPRIDTPLPTPPLAPLAPIQPTAPTETPPEAVVPPPSRGGRGFAERTLRGHSFLPPFFNDSAFITTNANVAVELGRQWSPDVPTQGSAALGTVNQTYQYDQTLGLVTQYAGFGVAVTDRVEVGVTGSYTGYLASDVTTALLFGSKSAWDLRPGARVRLVRGPATQLALHIYGDFGSGGWENPLGVLAEIAAESQTIGASTNQTACLAAGDLGCALTNSAFNAQTAALISRTSLGGGATLALAHAFGPSFGLQASLGLDAAYAMTNAGGNSVGSVPIYFHVGVAPSLDFGPNVPLTLMAEYMFGVLYEGTFAGTSTAGMSPDAGDTLTLRNQFALGLYYTATQRNFVVGLMANVTVDEAQVTFDDGTVGEQPTSHLSGQITARYFF